MLEGAVKYSTLPLAYLLALRWPCSIWGLELFLVITLQWETKAATTPSVVTRVVSCGCC